MSPRQVAGRLVVAMAIVAATATSAAGQPEAAGTLRRRGLDLGYNLDHREALAAFKAAIEADPSDPTAYRLAAATTWITVLFEQGSITVDDYLGQARAQVARPAPPATLDAAFHAYLERAIRLSEQHLRDYPRDAGAHFQVGAAYGFLASYTATVQGRLMGSFGPARRAYRAHERALQIDPRRHDAGLIVGLYRYAVSELSAPLRLLARIAGFGGDRRRALQLVEAAAAHASDVQPNALFTLALMYNREARYDAALRVIADLQRRFPRNRLLWLEAGNTLLRARRPAEAKVMLEEGLARFSNDPRPRAAGEESRWRYAYGAALVAVNDVAAAERELHTAVRVATRNWVRGRAHKELGKVKDLTGDRNAALEEYRLADRLCRADNDADGSSDARKLLKAAYRP